MKILTVVGARPQFVKAAVLSRKFKEYNIDEVIVHTGQHFDVNMSEVFFEELSIPRPNYNLEISSMSHGKMTGRMLEEIEMLIIAEKPDAVLVYGDTNSTLAGSLAAAKLHVQIIHVEAGLRSFNMRMPEEVNRVLTDRLSTLLLCPSQISMNNLKREGFDMKTDRILNVGDIMLDATIFYKKLAPKSRSIKSNYILCTIHRAENTDDELLLGEIVDSLNKLNEDKTVVVPLHPRTKSKLKEFGLKLNTIIIEPAGYLQMLELIGNSDLVITDSGGLQKEAYFFEKKCVTIRKETEWLELIKLGVNIISSAQDGNIVNDVKSMLARKVDFTSNIYGNGNAGELITKAILTMNV